MNSKEIRKAFLDFFNSKEHYFIPSSPMVVKNDPTLMFTNAGMNQFKDIFLGNKPAEHNRVVNSQKCLRVSGKHNDLEEVGHDTYHHTMFEMLGNWSFGNYFKKEAIDWAWEFLTETLKINKENLYATVFEGSKADNIEPDTEALEIWKKYLPSNHIIFGNKKDNFWEMGETGPCGPCSEIHIDLRDDIEKNKLTGDNLVNKGNPLVIEIWNLVFIQFNRKSNGILEPLPHKHVDTGMGFERLCMVMQNKKSNYDTDVFQNVITEISKLCKIKYSANEKSDIAMRVIADHLRAVSFSIADGQLPSNNGAGYVIKRILRRAIRYGYTFLNFNEPFIYKIVPTLVNNLGYYFTELASQSEFISKVIFEEETMFLRTLETGIKKFETFIEKNDLILNKDKIISGEFAFELFDTYGFPIDLTQVLAKEKNLTVNIEEFENCLEVQKQRSRKAAITETQDWIVVNDNENVEFVGYDNTSVVANIIKYRKVEQKGKHFFQVVFSKTPFYAECGGQIGDTGYVIWENNKLQIIDTKKENNLIVHIVNSLPADFKGECELVVDSERRQKIENNHSATHLLHLALRKVLGKHVEQKGSLVSESYLRFDFSHIQKMSAEEIDKTEDIVNELIRSSISLDENRAMQIDEAKKMGAMALFSEKYDNIVRVVKFGESVELCGGTHVKNTAKIGLFKIVSESAIAAGIRRIEAITSLQAIEYYKEQEKQLNVVKEQFKNPANLIKAVELHFAEYDNISKQLAEYEKEKAEKVVEMLIKSIKNTNGINTIFSQISLNNAGLLRDISFRVKAKVDNLFMVLSAQINNKANIAVTVSENLVTEKGLHAGKIVKEIAKEIDGNGGGQPFYATAGGTNVNGLSNALKKAENFVIN